MPHPKILDKEKTALVVVDMQEAFRSAISDFPLIASRISIAVRGFQIFDLPVIITEQYPKGLGERRRKFCFRLNRMLKLSRKPPLVRAARIRLMSVCNRQIFRRSFCAVWKLTSASIKPRTIF